MPNWCFTNMVVYGDREQLVLFKDYLDKIFALPHSTDPGLIDTHNVWLGKCLRVLGYSEEEIKHRYCRGWIDEYNVHLDADKPYIRVLYESAWCSCEDMFDYILTKHFNGLKQVCFVVEPNMDVCYHTDKEHLFFQDTYSLDCCYNGIESYEYYESEDEFIKAFNNIYGTSFFSVSTIEKFIDSSDELNDGDNYCVMHAYRY